MPKDTCLEKIDYVTLRRSCPYGEVQCCIVKFQGSEPSTTTAATTTTTEGLDNDDLIMRGYNFDVEELIARGYKCFLARSGDVPEYDDDNDVDGDEDHHDDEVGPGQDRGTL